MINPMSLSNRTIIVTGASSGLGRATSIMLSQLGAKVVLVGRNSDQLQNTLDLMEGNSHSIKPFDLLQLNDIQDWIKDIAAEVGLINGLVHSAGIVATLPMRIIKLQKFEEMIKVNYLSAVALTKVLRLKKVKGCPMSIVLYSSAAGLTGIPGLTAYSGSKGALIAFSRSAAKELASEEIRINTIAPGHVMTEMVEQTKASMGEKQFAELEARYPLGLGQPKDIANATAFLLSDASRWITGTTMLVDGGSLTN